MKPCKDTLLTILARVIRGIGLTMAGLFGIAVTLLLATFVWRTYLFVSVLNAERFKEVALGGGAGLLFISIFWWSCVAFVWATDYLRVKRHK